MLCDKSGYSRPTRAAKTGSMQEGSWPLPSHEHPRRGAAVPCDVWPISGHRHQRGGRRSTVLRRQIYRACLTTSCSHGTRCSMSKVPASSSLIMRL